MLRHPAISRGSCRSASPYQLKQLAGRNAEAGDLSRENIARVNRME
jgi:hypothetical protein